MSAKRLVDAQIKHLDNRSKANSYRSKQRLFATNQNITDVEWLQNLNEETIWIKGDSIQEISQQLKQNRQAGKATNELHIVAAIFLVFA